MKTLPTQKLRIHVAETKTPKECGCIYTAISLRTHDGELDLSCVEDKPGKDQVAVRRRAFAMASFALNDALKDLQKRAKKEGIVI